MLSCTMKQMCYKTTYIIFITIYIMVPIFFKISVQVGEIF